MSFCSVFLTAMTSSDFRTTDSPGPELVCRHLLSDDRHRDIRHPNQSIQYTLLSNLRPPEYFGCARNAAAINRSTVIEIFCGAAPLLTVYCSWDDHTGFPLESIRACRSGYIGGLYTYVSSGALLSPVSHTRRFLDQFLWWWLAARRIQLA
jgi:hypothetical protein